MAPAQPAGGEIPPELGSLSNLERLDISDNQLSGEDAGGTGQPLQPGELGYQHNRLSGMPADWAASANLTRLNLPPLNNRLSGEIPRSWAASPTWSGLVGSSSNLKSERGQPGMLGSLSNLERLDQRQSLSGCRRNWAASPTWKSLGPQRQPADRDPRGQPLDLHALHEQPEIPGLGTSPTWSGCGSSATS